jgi:hypothetical protein
MPPDGVLPFFGVFFGFCGAVVFRRAATGGSVENGCLLF